RADCEVRRVKAPNPPLSRRRVHARVVEAGRPDHARNSTLERSPNVRLDGVGNGEIDHCLGPVDLDELVACLLEHRREDPADLAATPVEGELHAARASTAGLMRRAAARKIRSVGPMPEIESFSGANRSPASSATSSGSTASISAMIRSNERSSVFVMSDFPSLVIRFDVDSMESMIRPFK